MIFYFSGTGNSKWAAEQLASKTADIAANMIDQTSVPSLDGQSIGLVFPVYAWGVPEPVRDFVKLLHGKPKFTFGVCTCGGEAGLAMESLNRIFPLESTYSLNMPNNYVMGSELESPDEIASKIAAAAERLDLISEQIIARKRVGDVHTGSLAWIKSNIFNFGFNLAARRTKPFYVTDKCTSCGQCARDCPANTITMIEGRPHWGEKCFQCTACINRCPVRAIEYGKGTPARGRYQIEDHLN